MATDYAWILSEKYKGTEWSMNGDDYSGLNWIDKVAPKPTQLELDNLYASHKAATDYLRNRETEMPSAQEQLKMQYDDLVNGTTTWADTMAALYAKYPKPA